MYRSAAAVAADDETLYWTTLSTAQGRDAMLFFSSLATLAAFSFIGTLMGSWDPHILFGGPPVFGVSVLAAWISSRRRKRIARIVRRGGELRLLVERADFDLRFPLRVAGEQVFYNASRGANHVYVHLQVADDTQRSFVFVERRRDNDGSGWVDGWPKSGIDRSLTHREFDTDDVVELRSKVEALDESLAKPS